MTETQIISTFLSIRPFHSVPVKIFRYMWENLEYRQAWYEFNLDLFSMIENKFKFDLDRLSNITVCVPAIRKELMMLDVYQNVPYVDYNYIIKKPDAILRNPYKEKCEGAVKARLSSETSEIKAIWGDKVLLQHDELKSISKLQGEKRKLAMFYKRPITKEDDEAKLTKDMIQVFKNFYQVEDPNETNLSTIVSKGVPYMKPKYIVKDLKPSQYQEVKEFQAIYAKHLQYEAERELYEQALKRYENDVKEQKEQIKRNKIEIRRYLQEKYKPIPVFNSKKSEIQEGKTSGLFDYKRTKVN